MGREVGGGFRIRNMCRRALAPAWRFRAPAAGAHGAPLRAERGPDRGAELAGDAQSEKGGWAAGCSHSKFPQAGPRRSRNRAIKVTDKPLEYSPLLDPAPPHRRLPLKSRATASAASDPGVMTPRVQDTDWSPPPLQRNEIPPHLGQTSPPHLSKGTTPRGRRPVPVLAMHTNSPTRGNTKKYPSPGGECPFSGAQIHTRLSGEPGPLPRSLGWALGSGRGVRELGSTPPRPHTPSPSSA